MVKWLSREKDMDMEKLLILMVNPIKVILSRDKYMEKEYYIIVLEMFIKVVSNKENAMDRGKKPTIMVHPIPVITKMGWKTEKVN